MLQLGPVAGAGAAAACRFWRAWETWPDEDVMRGMWAETNVNAEESETAITTAAVVIELMWTMVVARLLG